MQYVEIASLALNVLCLAGISVLMFVRFSSKKSIEARCRCGRPYSFRASELDPGECYLCRARKV